MTAFLTRRQLLQAGGLTLGALSLGRHAAGQAQKDGGTFVSARTTEATGLDPQLVPAFSRSARSPMMYNQLVRFEPDMTPVPELAESWQVSSDSLQWTFKLRQGVKFHDGQELTSADVKFTFDRLFEKSPGKSDLDRKSTRLNSSHGYISYAVFCLKKKKEHGSMRIAVSHNKNTIQ